MSTLRHTVAANIKRLAASQGFDNAKLQEAMGISAKSLEMVLSGVRAPGLEEIGSLADAMGVSIDALVAHHYED